MKTTSSKDMRKELKDWLSGIPGREFHKGIVISVGTKYVTWISLYEGSTRQKFSMDDFYNVIFGKESFEDLLFESQR